MKEGFNFVDLCKHCLGAISVPRRGNLNGGFIRIVPDWVDREVPPCTCDLPPESEPLGIPSDFYNHFVF